MSRNIQSIKGRWILMIMVLGSCVSSFIILYIVGRGDAIAAEAARVTIKELLEIYLPLIAMMAAFYFGQPKATSIDSVTSLEVFVFAILTVGIWVFIPPLLILFGEAIEDVIETIGLFKPYGETVAAAGVAFYFAKTMQ